MSINDADLVIIPGAGFDASGNRIGYGGGYYDRLLSGLRKHVPVIAPAYEEQVVDSLPSEPEVMLGKNYRRISGRGRTLARRYDWYKQSLRKLKNYYYSLSDAYLEVVQKLLRNRAFIKAVQREG